MNESEERLNTAAARKEKIRQRYRGINPDELDVIPALPQEDFYQGDSEKRVAVYARVSTDDPRQTSSYELQKNHYQDVVSRHPGWKLINIYADEGISGTSLQHRDAFIQMIADCHAGKIDLIVTKSVSRFARNVLDCIGQVRELAALHPPIGVFFETENIYTLNSNSEMSLSFISTLAQEESHTKSEIMNSSIEMRFKRGIFLTPPLLGYDQDEDGNLIINEEEAKTVRLIFFMYLYGYTCQEIADQLTTLGRRTKKGNTVWSHGSVLGILQNERHCGDVLARKTWTPSYLDHKSKKNRQDRNQYRKRDHHEPIISRDDFIAVQRLISNAKYGNKGILPELSVISNGILKGFVSINPRWAGFKADSYRQASESIYDKAIVLPDEPLEIEAQSGDFDLRGYEIARSQFFNIGNKLSITFSADKINFSTEAIRRFETPYVELLVHPAKHIFAVRPATNNDRNAVQWSRLHNGQTIPRIISGAAFLPNLYELFGWNLDNKYRLVGEIRQNEAESFLLFNLRDTEILIPNNTLQNEDDETTETPIFEDGISPLGTRKSMLAYPADWASSFGNNYYANSQPLSVKPGEEWRVHAEGEKFETEPALMVTAPETVKENINTIIQDMTQEDNDE